jgi:hypothetical protein
MGKIATSSIFYRRGVPNNCPNFGTLVQANYPIVQPQTFFINFISVNQKRKPFVYTG